MSSHEETTSNKPRMNIECTRRVQLKYTSGAELHRKYTAEVQLRCSMAHFFSAMPLAWILHWDWRGFMRLRTAVLTVLAVLALTAQPSFSGDACSGVSMDGILAGVGSRNWRAFLKGASIRSMRPVEEMGVCEAILKMPRGGYMACYVSSGNVIVGHLFADGKDRSQARISELRKADFAAARPELDRAVAFTYTPDGRKRGEVYMITDPLCPFCHRAEAGIIEIADQFNVELKVILYGVHGKDSDRRGIQAVCEHLSFADYVKDDWKKRPLDEDQCEEGKMLIARAKEAVGKLGIGGVPMFFLEDGGSVTGANLPELKKRLGALRQQRERE